MDDLLKDAIADAKAVRETALENAKIALEEAFTPRLQSMLSKKIQSEVEDEDDMEEDSYDEDEEAEVPAPEPEMEEDDEIEAEPEPEMEEDEESEPEMEEEGVIEINGVKYAPVVSEEEEEEESDEMAEDEDEDDLDLEAVIKELESELEEGEDGDAEEEEPVAEGDDEEDEEPVAEGEEAKEDDAEVDEDIDLEEVLKALSEDDDEEEEVAEVAKLQSDLDEHRNVVKYLRTKLNEVNLLNAKLLFTNKLFRSHGLSNEQKMKVVETFDRATNLREVKLVYSTLAESFGSTQTKSKIKETKGSASKVVASTKSKKAEVISEGHELRDRFMKLAGIL